MLTRLEVSGFKNLVDLDVRFGPLTCIAGLNGVGKSNIFDAISFLSRLADLPFVQAAKTVRGGDSPSDVFTRGGDGKMVLAAEMLIRGQGRDDFGQPAEASATYLRYEVELQLERIGSLPAERIRLEREELNYLTKGDAAGRLGFRHDPGWRDSVIISSKRRTRFISMDEDRPDLICLHSDRMRREDQSKRGGGAIKRFASADLPRTVLSSAQNAEETRTAVLVRQEMRNWRQLQLEPTALRKPDDPETSPSRLDVTGANLPATLHRLAHSPERQEAQVYAATANRLSELVEGIREVRVDLDRDRRLLRLMLTDRHGQEFPANSVSDGTLRFVALVVLEQDGEETGVICVEEPENGIHPQRVRAMVELLYDLAVDPMEPGGPENPLRQVILTTHSSLVAGETRDEDLLFASLIDKPVNGRRGPALELQCIADTWRTKADDTPTIRRGRLIEYIVGLSPRINSSDANRSSGRQKVKDVVRQQTFAFDETGS